MGQLLPVIKHFEWFKNDALILKEQLLDFEESPVIGIAEDLDTMIKYAEAVNAEIYAKELLEKKAAAISNLLQLEVTYEIQEVNGSKVAVASGQEFASEKILDKEFLKKIHLELDSDQIAIGIPFQGLFIAISAKDTELVAKFPMVVKRHFDKPQADKISDRVFLSLHAEIVAHAGADNIAPAATTEEPCFVQTMTIPGISELEDEHVVFIGHKSIEVLRNTMIKTFSELIAKSNDGKKNSCHIKYMVIPDIVENNSALVGLCESLVASFCTRENLIVTTLHSMKVTFIYATDSLIAEGEITR